MKLTVTYFDDLLDISITPTATKMLEEMHGPLYVDARLYFGCLPKKTIVFNEVFEADTGHMINSKLFIRYQSLIAAGCNVDGAEAVYQPTPKHAGALRWLKIDYRNGEWIGEFGLERKARDEEQNIELYVKANPMI